MTMFSGTYSISPAVVMLMSRYGEAIQECRELAGFDKQGEAAVASYLLASEYPELFQAFSQQWLSRPDVFPLTGHLLCACGARLYGKTRQSPSTPATHLRPDVYRRAD